MASMKLTERSSPLIDRLDDVQMSETDRERAKQMMRQAEAFAEAAARIQELVGHAAIAIASTFAAFPERLRSALSQGVHR